MGCGASSPSTVSPNDKHHHNHHHEANKGGLSGFLSRRALESNPLMEARVKEALKAIIFDRERKERIGNISTSASFNRIILKFPAIRRAFISIHAVFREFDSDNSGTIDASELLQCMHALGAKDMTEEGVKEMFTYAIIPKEHTNGKKKSKTKSVLALTFKEFLLCLAIGSVLQLFPLFRAYSAIDIKKYVDTGSLRNIDYDGGGSGDSGTYSSPPPTDHSSPAPSEASVQRRTTSEEVAAAAIAAKVAVSNVMKPNGKQAFIPKSDDNTDPFLLLQGRHLVNALKLVLEAYILFDNDGSGSIDRNEVLRMIDEENRKAKATGKKKAGQVGTSALLSKERWLELDWDSDGQITFKEFLFALFTWVGIDDEDSMDLPNAAPSETNSELNSRRISGTSTNNAGNPSSVSTTPKTDLSNVDQEIDEALQLPPPRSISTRSIDHSHNINSNLKINTSGIINNQSSHPSHPSSPTHQLILEHPSASSSSAASTGLTSTTTSNTHNPDEANINMHDLTSNTTANITTNDPNVVVPFIHSKPLNHHEHHHHDPNASVRFVAE